MNIDEMFRHFFGFDDHLNRRHPFDDFWSDSPLSDDHGEFENADPRNFGRGEDFHFHSFNSPFGIMKHLEDMFRNFGLAEFPLIGPDIQEIKPPEFGPREKMLKDYDTQPPSFRSPWYRGILEHPYDNRTEVEDSDLDKKVSEGGLGVLVPDRRMEINPRSFFSSVSIRTIRGADGKMEEHRTVRDSSGKEETTVRRVIGNESHSVTTVKDGEGLKEKWEDFVNLDEGSLRDFDRKWETPDTSVKPPERNLPVPYDYSYGTIFKKLFGFNPSRSEK